MTPLKIAEDVVYEEMDGSSCALALQPSVRTVAGRRARAIIAALEAAGYRIVHPDRVTERMASAAGEEVLAQYSACMHWEEAKDVVEGLDDASVISVAIAAAPTYATPAAGTEP